MKKIITLLLVLLCCVSTVFAIDIDEGPKQTEISYNVEETYDWIVPVRSELDLSNETQLSGDVIVNRCIIAPNKQLIISLDDADGVNDMLLEHGKEKLAYEVSKTSSGTTLVAGDKILSVSSGELTTSGSGSTKAQSLYSKISEKPKIAGIYEDILTFVAKVVEKEIKELYRWELVPSWDAYTGLYDYLGNLVGESSTERSFDVEGYFLDSGEKFNSLRISCHGAIGLETYNNNEYLNMPLFETMGDDASYAPEDFGPIVVTDGKDAENETLLHILRWVGNVTYPVVVSDLTGYSWIGNEELEPFSSVVGDYDFNFNWQTSSKTQYSGFSFSVGDNYWCLNTPTGGLDIYFYTEEPAASDNGWNTAHEVYETSNKTITILGGEDVTNTNLIKWLQTNGTLVAPTMPEKGDVITIEGNDYVVLEVNGTEAKIMVKEPVFSGDMTIDGMAVAEPFDGGKLGIKYKDSNLDVFLENSFYPSLSENIKNAIIEKEITQDMRSNIKKEGEAAAVSYKKVDSTLVGKRHVYAVSIEDILGYLGLDDSAIFDMNEQDLSLNFPSRMKKEIFINAIDYDVYYLRDSSEKNHYLLSLSKLPTQDKAGITSLYPYLQTTFAEFVINLAKVDWE